MGSGDARGVRLSLAYDGTDFSGWQVQPGQRTVQQAVQDAVHAMTGERVRVLGASRTDAGVHAEGQVAAFDTCHRIAMEGWLKGLNGELPKDVAVTAAHACAAGHNPRYDARSKRYRYRIAAGRTRSPLLRRQTWFVGPSLSLPGNASTRQVGAAAWLDLGAMRAAGAALVGTHDFAAFQASNDPREQTRRTLISVDVHADVEDRPGLIAIDVHGTAFLKNMVRIMAGTLVEVGRHRMTPGDVVASLGEGQCREAAGPTAPAQGLTLVSIELGREPKSASSR